MKRLAISFIPIIFFLFIMGNVDAFATSKNVILPSNYHPEWLNPFSRIIYDTPSRKWFIASAYYGTYCTIAKYDNNFTSLLNGWSITTQIQDAKGCDLKDWNSTHLLWAYGHTSGTAITVHRRFVSKNDLTLGSENENNFYWYYGTGVWGDLALTDVGMMIGKNGSSIDGTDSILIVTLSNETYRISIPSGHTSIFDLQLLDLTNQINEYWVSYTDLTVLKTYIERYDTSFNWIAGFQTSTGSVVYVHRYKTPTGVLGHYGSQYSQIENNLVYQVIHQFESDQNNNTWHFQIIDPVAVKQDGLLHVVNEQDLDLQLNDSTRETVENQTQAMSFDIADNQLYFFYRQYNISKTATAQIGNDTFIFETIGCSCGSWLNDACVNEKMKQHRTCVPYLCTDQIQYIDSNYCAYQENVSENIFTQKYTSVCDSTPCEDARGWLDPYTYPTSSCQAQIDLPINATGINTTAWLQPQVDYRSNTFGVGGLGTARYSIRSCNPLENCYNSSYLCESQINITYPVDYNSYSAGSQAIAYFEISSANKCKIKNLLWYDFGWILYKVRGTLEYCYNKACGGTICMQQGILIKSCQQNIDCTTNMTSCVTCTSGTCDEGICGESQSTVTTITSPSGNMVDWGMKEIKAQFGFGGGWFLSLIAISLSSGIGIWVQRLSGNWRISLGVIMGFILLFLTMGFLPPFISIIWILTIALILASMLKQKVVGE